jgi:hypothetical protein
MLQARFVAGFSPPRPDFQPGAPKRFVVSSVQRQQVFFSAITSVLPSCSMFIRVIIDATRTERLAMSINKSQNKKDGCQSNSW